MVILDQNILPTHRVMLLRALDATFSLDVGSRELGNRLRQTFHGLAWNGGAAHVITVGVRSPGNAPGEGRSIVELTIDGRTWGTATTYVDIVDSIIAALNVAAIEESGRYLLLHAASAHLDGQAVVLPAPSGSGKSTLASQLVDGGFSYVADEIVAIDPGTNRVVPYPKPIVLADGRGSSTVRVLPFNGEEVEIALIVSPHFGSSSGPLRLLSRAEAVVMLAENAFNFHEHGAAALPILSSVVRQCETYAVDVAEGPTIVPQIRRLLVEQGDRS